MRELHPNQKKLLDFLRKNIDDPLTMEDLKDKLGVASTSVVHHHIVQLEKKGYLKRNPSNSRDYMILLDPEKPVVYLNKYGLAHCGPGQSILDGSPVDRVPIASSLLKFSSDEAFIVTAKGDSMEPEINEGDMIIAQKIQSLPKSGSMVICVDEGMAKVKLLLYNNKQSFLHSLNKKYSPSITSDDFRIVGVVRSVLKYH